MKEILKTIGGIVVIIGGIILWAGITHLAQPTSQEEAEEQYSDGPGLVRR